MPTPLEIEFAGFDPNLLEKLIKMVSQRAEATWMSFFAPGSAETASARAQQSDEHCLVPSLPSDGRPRGREEIRGSPPPHHLPHPSNHLSQNHRRRREIQPRKPRVICTTR